MADGSDAFEASALRGVLRKAQDAVRAVGYNDELARYHGPARDTEDDDSHLVIGAGVFYKSSEQGWLLGVLRRKAVWTNDSECVYLVHPAPEAADPPTPPTTSFTKSEVSTMSLVANLSQYSGAGTPFIKVPRDELYPCPELAVATVQDLLDLSDGHEAIVLHQLREMHREERVYVSVGPEVLLFLNPGRDRSELYSNSAFRRFCDASMRYDANLPPHIWGLAHGIHQRCTVGPAGDVVHEAVVFSGMPGSGKSTAANLALKLFVYAGVADVSGPRRRQTEVMAERFLDLNQVLESFGCATTRHQAHSSRMTRWVDVALDGGLFVGGRFDLLQLERGRIADVPFGERCYHCFYQLLAGVDGAHRTKLGLANPAAYAWLFVDVAPNEEDERADAAAYAHMHNVLAASGFRACDLLFVDEILAGIIHLRGIDPTDPTVGRRLVSADAERRIATAAALWGLQPEALLTTFTAEAAQEHSPPPEAVKAVRDRLCVSVYTGLVEWLLHGVNAAAAPPAGGAVRWVGLLDVFAQGGAGHGRAGSLEALAMHSVEDDVEHLYVDSMFHEERALSSEDGLPEPVVPNHSGILDAVSGARGILSAVDAHTSRPADDEPEEDSLLLQERIADVCAASPHIHLEREHGTLIVQHAVGPQRYGIIAAWRHDNTNPFAPAFPALFERSSNEVLTWIFTEPDPGRKLLIARDLYRERLSARHARTRAYLRTQLAHRSRSWCRCVQPCLAGTGYSGADVLAQLERRALMHTVHTKVQTLNTAKMPHREFVRRYKGVLKGSNFMEYSTADAIEAILDVASIPEGHGVVVGQRKIHVHKDVQRKLEELACTTMYSHTMKFLKEKLRRKSEQLRRNDSNASEAESKLPSLGTSFMQMAKHFPVLLAFARAYLASKAVIELLQPCYESTEEAATTPLVQPTTLSKKEYLSTMSADAPLKKLATWRQKSEEDKEVMNPPPAAVDLGDAPALRSVDDFALHSSMNFATGSFVPQLNYINPDFREPNISKRRFHSIINRDYDRLAAMTLDERYEILARGKRDVRTSLNLSAEAITAIKRLVAQAQLHEKHERAFTNTEPEPTAWADSAERFPDELGPFGLEALSGVVTSVAAAVPSSCLSSVATGNGSYVVEPSGSSAVLGELGLCEGAASPPTPVLVPLRMRRRCGIPRSAHSQVYAYPLPGTEWLADKPYDDGTLPARVHLILSGGIVFSDLRGQPMSAHAFVPGASVTFAPPQRWPQNNSTRAFERSGRMMPAPVPLRAKGAKYYAWLLPGDDLGDITPKPASGGFVFLFRTLAEPPSPQDCYFCMHDLGNAMAASHAGSDVASLRSGYSQVSGSPNLSPVSRTGSHQGERRERDPFADDIACGRRVELPKIEGVKELEGVVVHHSVASAIDEIIKSDLPVQSLRLGMERLNPSTRIALLKQDEGVPFDEPAVLSPVRHHMRPAGEFLDVDGAWLGWDPAARTARTAPPLDFSGQGYPFPLGISTRLSPIRRFCQSVNNDGTADAAENIKGSLSKVSEFSQAMLDVGDMVARFKRPQGPAPPAP